MPNGAEIRIVDLEGRRVEVHIYPSIEGCGVYREPSPKEEIRSEYVGGSISNIK